MTNTTNNQGGAGEKSAENKKAELRLRLADAHEAQVVGHRKDAFIRTSTNIGNNYSSPAFCFSSARELVRAGTDAMIVERGFEAVKWAIAVGGASEAELDLKREGDKVAKRVVGDINRLIEQLVSMRDGVAANVAETMPAIVEQLKKVVALAD